jgi:creatinine amidohydrolase
MAVLEYVDLTLEELKSLAEKAEKTVFTMAVSPIEVHGPHLPLGTDILIATAVRDRVQSRVSQKDPDVTFVNLPPLYCGSDALPYPGSLSVSAASLSGVLYDYSKGLARQGFKYLFIFDNHGGPRHHLGIAAASEKAWSRHRFYLVDPFIDIYRRMVMHDSELLSQTGLEPGACGDDADNHAGTNETSLVMAVSDDYAGKDFSGIAASLPPQLTSAARAVDALGRTIESLGASRAGPDLRHLAQALAWTGERDFRPYMGAPALASRAAGEAMLEAHVRISVELIEQAMSGREVRLKPILQSLSFLRHLPE